MGKLTTKKKHVIKFITGDPDGDGHGQVEEFYVNSNIPVAVLEKYYKRHPKQLGFDLNEICNREGLDEMDKEDVLAIRKSGISLNGIDSLFQPAPIEMVTLQMNTLKAMIPELEWSFMEIPHKTFKYSVGYGLFD